MAPLAAVSLIAAAGYWAYSRYYATGNQGSRVLASSKDKSTTSLKTQTRISLVVSKVGKEVPKGLLLLMSFPSL
jgi:hypothetical protein